MPIINNIYRGFLADLAMYRGKKQTARGFSTKEIVGNTLQVDMNEPLITCTHRNMGYKFALAEASWIISGSNKVEEIAEFSKHIAQFSDDGEHFFGAYGPKIVDQLEYIGRSFKTDLDTRQAVINIWREKPPVSKDIPCTLSIQFLIREDRDGTKRLHLIDTMRSSDAWLGIPYDIFSFSMVGAYVAIYLRNYLKIDLKLGSLLICAGSSHIYTDDKFYPLKKVGKLIESIEIDFTYKPIDLSEFEKPKDLVEHLWDLAHIGFGTTDKKWLCELEEYWRKKNEQQNRKK